MTARKRINDSQFMKDIRAEIEKARRRSCSSDAWFAGGVASKASASASPRTSRA